jgi:hypothetical protein
MNRIAFIAIAVLVVVGTAVADPVCTSGAIEVGPSTTIQCGGLTFSSFNVVPVTGNQNPVIDFVSADTGGGSVNLVFNPNLSGATSAQSANFYYQVTGGTLDSLDLTVGGVGATVTEIACTSPIATSGPQANTCSTSPLVTLTAMSSPPGPNHAVSSFASTGGTVYLYSTVSSAQGGGLTNFVQSFHSAGSAIPEPMSVILTVSGLAGLGLLRRLLGRA